MEGLLGGRPSCSHTKEGGRRCWTYSAWQSRASEGPLGVWLLVRELELEPSAGHPSSPLDSLCSLLSSWAHHLEAGQREAASGAEGAPFRTEAPEYGLQRKREMYNSHDIYVLCQIKPSTRILQVGYTWEQPRLWFQVLSITLDY